MTTARKTLLLATLLLVPVGLAGFAFLLGKERPAGRALALPEPAREVPGELAEPEVELLPVPVVRTATGDVRSTVLWPLKLELELAEARFLPRQEGVVPVGSGANARFSGQISGFDERGVAAEIRFLAGANSGRVLRCDVDGRFGAADLYPGLSIVEVRGAGILGSRREVRLRRGQETLLNIGYGRPSAVFGRVQDASGAGLSGAEVWVDGSRVVSDQDGGFYLASIAAGPVLVEADMPGYALYQETVWLTGGAVTTKERMTLTLRPAVELRVALQGNVGGPGPARLFLLSDAKAYSSSAVQRSISFPWHRINPVEVYPGSPVTIGRLPPDVVKVHAFRPGARAPVKPVNLAGNVRDITIELQPAPTLSGRVLEDGQPVLGATVRLEAPDRVRATLGYFAESSYFLETAVLPSLPPGFQEVTTGKDGRFVLSSWSEESPVRYVEARGPGGGSWAGRLVQPDEEQIELELEAVNLGESTLRVEFPGRHQGLPVELWIGGSPSPVQILAADQDLVVENLVAGRWRLRVTWRGQPVRQEEELDLEGSSSLSVALPPECLDGQDEEQWRRAGREYPHGS